MMNMMLTTARFLRGQKVGPRIHNIPLGCNIRKDSPDAAFDSSMQARIFYIGGNIHSMRLLLRFTRAQDDVNAKEFELTKRRE